MPGPSTLSTTPNALTCLTENEIRRLVWLSGTVAAERHLVPIDQPCPDHEQCRRLAFAPWASASGVVREYQGCDSMFAIWPSHRTVGKLLQSTWSPLLACCSAYKHSRSTNAGRGLDVLLKEQLARETRRKTVEC